MISTTLVMNRINIFPCSNRLAFPKFWQANRWGRMNFQQGEGLSLVGAFSSPWLWKVPKGSFTALLHMIHVECGLWWDVDRVAVQCRRDVLVARDRCCSLAMSGHQIVHLIHHTLAGKTSAPHHQYSCKARTASISSHSLIYMGCCHSQGENIWGEWTG